MVVEVDFRTNVSVTSVMLMHVTVSGVTHMRSSRWNSGPRSPERSSYCCGPDMLVHPVTCPRVALRKFLLPSLKLASFSFDRSLNF